MRDHSYIETLIGQSTDLQQGPPRPQKQCRILRPLLASRHFGSVHEPKGTGHVGIATDSVDRWIESKSLPAHRVGRLWKFKLSQVDAWIEAAGAAEREDHENNG